jgi:hypothetical protein
LGIGLGEAQVEKSKRKNGELDTKRYWQIFGTLAIVLLIMVRFPVRVWLIETLDDILIFGILSLGCLYTALRVYRQRRWQSWRLMAVILLCAALSGWQVFDLAVLRLDSGIVSLSFGWGRDVPDYIGRGWYNPRFPNEDIYCHSIYEGYFGNGYIAITTDIQHTTWYACGG